MSQSVVAWRVSSQLTVELLQLHRTATDSVLLIFPCVSLACNSTATPNLSECSSWVLSSGSGSAHVAPCAVTGYQIAESIARSAHRLCSPLIAESAEVRCMSVFACTRRLSQRSIPARDVKRGGLPAAAATTAAGIQHIGAAMRRSATSSRWCASLAHRRCTCWRSWRRARRCRRST